MRANRRTLDRAAPQRASLRLAPCRSCICACKEVPLRPGARRSREAASAFGSVRLVGLLLDDPRPELHIDALLDGRALVVLDVHRARQLDESRVERLRALLVANVIF